MAKGKKKYIDLCCKDRAANVLKIYITDRYDIEGLLQMF